MKKTLLLFSLCGAIYLGLSSSSLGPSTTPADVQTAKNGCGGSGCHGASFTPASITIDLAELGKPAVTDNKYSPGTDYQVGVTIFAPTYKEFGYIMLATDGSNNQAGTWDNSLSNPNIKITTKGAYTVAEHPAPADSFAGGFAIAPDWKAPPKGTGAVTFYVAINATNGNGVADAGDNYALISKTYQEGPPKSVEDIDREAKIICYPNPANHLLNIDIQNMASNKYYYIIYSTSGAIANQGHMSNNTNSLDISVLQSGTYFLNITNGNSTKTVSFKKL